MESDSRMEDVQEKPGKTRVNGAQTPVSSTPCRTEEVFQFEMAAPAQQLSCATGVDGMPSVNSQLCTSPAAVGHSSETRLPLGCSLTMEARLLLCLDVSRLDVSCSDVS